MAPQLLDQICITILFANCLNRGQSCNNPDGQTVWTEVSESHAESDHGWRHREEAECDLLQRAETTSSSLILACPIINNMKYQFNSRVGLVSLTPHDRLAQLCQLWLGSFLIGTYSSLATAAAAVSNGKTGCSALDRLPSTERPASLAEWQRSDRMQSVA